MRPSPRARSSTRGGHLHAPAAAALASARLGDVRQMRITSSMRRDGDELPFEDVPAPLGLAQQVLGPPADDLDAVVEELLAASP